MKKAVLSFLIILFASTSFALPINDRVSPLDPGPGDGNEPSVQAIFDGLTGGAIDAVNDQSNVALWTPAELGIAAYKITYWTGNTGAFGIYSAATGQMVDLFSKTVANPINPAAGQKAHFDILDDGSLFLNGTSYSGFGSTFGFYWDGGFTEDTKNNGTVKALVYNLPDGTPLNMPSPWRNTVSSGGNDWLMAFGDSGGANDDFNDLIVLIEDIAPVPEPGTLLLLGGGLLGLVYLHKRKKA